VVMGVDPAQHDWKYGSPIAVGAVTCSDHAEHMGAHEKVASGLVQKVKIKAVRQVSGSQNVIWKIIKFFISP